MESRPIILRIPENTEHITVSCIVRNELIEFEFDVSDKKQALYGKEKYERKLD